MVIKPPAERGMRCDLCISDAKIGMDGVISQPVLPRAALDLRHPIAAKPLVGEEALRRAGPIRAHQYRRERHAVLDRLIGALSEMRKHWMRGIAEQAEPLPGPGRQWLAIVECPSEREL